MRNRVFKDKKKLSQMFNKRQEGFDIVSLGIIFGADFTTIDHHLRRNNIQKMGKLSFKIPAILSTFEIKQRPKKSYLDYLREEQDRRKRPLSQLISKF